MADRLGRSGECASIYSAEKDEVARSVVEKGAHQPDVGDESGLSERMVG